MDQDKPRFYVRLKFRHKTGCIVKSAKTTDEYEARKFAEDLYYELEGKLRRGEQINYYPFSKVFNDWANYRRIDGKERAYTEPDIRGAEIYLLPYFKDTEIRIVLHVAGKTGDREVVCNEGVKRYITRLYDFRKDELGEEPPRSEFIFTPRNGSPIKSFKKSFSTLLEKSGLTFNSDGHKRVLYSLRHMYATMRLQEGVSIFQLASNMGTSVEMIDTFYGKKRNTTPKAATPLGKLNQNLCCK